MLHFDAAHTNLHNRHTSQTMNVDHYNSTMTQSPHGSSERPSTLEHLDALGSPDLFEFIRDLENGLYDNDDPLSSSEEEQPSSQESTVTHSCVKTASYARSIAEELNNVNANAHGANNVAQRFSPLNRNKGCVAVMTNQTVPLRYPVQSNNLQFSMMMQSTSTGGCSNQPFNASDLPPRQFATVASDDYSPNYSSNGASKSKRKIDDVVTNANAPTAASEYATATVSKTAQANDSNPASDKAKACRCLKTQCLKKYCLCFSAERTCGSQCKCKDCHNTEMITR